MQVDYMSFEYGRKDGTIQSRDEFYAEHSDIAITPVQKARLEQNVERQSLLILKEYANRDIILEGYYETFIYKDNQTDELYLKPLYEIEIKVFFKKMMPILLIYDIRAA